MFAALLHDLNETQRAQLRDRGISRDVLWKWKREERLPTEVQVADLADVTGTPWEELQREVTVLRAPPERRKAIAKAIGALRYL